MSFCAWRASSSGFVTSWLCCVFFFQAEDGIRDHCVTGVQTCALPISVSAVTSRYDDYKNAGGMALVPDTPSGSCGAASMQLTADGRNAATQATDLYKRLDTGQDELYERWYAKYQAGAPWHHTGVWFGGYNPPSDWPNPQAGIRPLGDDRVSFAVEPVWGNGGPNPVLDFYNYWMQMHTCSGCGGSYWGNALISRTAVAASDYTRARRAGHG